MTTLGAWLKDQGFTVDDDTVPYGRESTWRGVSHLLVHHTVSDCDGSEQSIADYCKYQGSYPPLCQIVLGHSGKVWMTCKERSGQSDPGRASHAGSGDGYGVPRDSMNECSIGIECQCDGTHPIATHTTQYETLVRLLAALSRRYDVPVANIIGHKEWSSTGKVDPRDDMDDIRADVADALEEGDGMAAYDYDYLGKPGGTQIIETGYQTLEDSHFDPPRAGWENTYVYLNIKPLNWKDSQETAGILRVRIVRDDGDSTGHQDLVIIRRLNDDGTLKLPGGSLDEDGRTLRHVVYWEAGDSKPTKVQVKCEGGLTRCELGTRYTKKATVLP